MLDDKHAHTHRQNRFAVIPTSSKLGALPDFKGRGVTIAFLDSGFRAHPDFAGRIIAFHDVSGEEHSLADGDPGAVHWHGTQTVSACAGDGSLSDGVYKGLAPASKLVLVKVSRNGSIGDAEIEAGLRWVAANRERLKIRILNMSLGGDRDESSDTSAINRLAESLVEAGVVVTVAAGNAGDARSIPPANAPSVITVGGFSDSNSLDTADFGLYGSNHGPTIDGIVKPEIIAPAMFVAAPILPGTNDYSAAESLSILADTPDYAFRHMLAELFNSTGLSDEAHDLPLADLRELVENELHRRRVVATHYQHVDGTSFAAPIAASVVAQMLEANPNLTPAAVKHVLISTAFRLTGFPAIRQGFGVLNATNAVARVLGESHALSGNELIPPRVSAGEIVFFHHDDDAESISLAGDFNDWNPQIEKFERGKNGVWKAAIAPLPSGEYRYKYVIDGKFWREDPNNLLKREDGFGGFHSILRVM